MIQSARFTNINGVYVDLNTDDIPFSSFTTEVDWRFTEKPKSQEHGIYPGESYLGKRLFHCEGDLFGSSAADYMQRRVALLEALMPNPQKRAKIVGTLDIVFDGISETLSADCTLDGWPELPLEALKPARSSFQINFKSYDPRLYGDDRSVDIIYNPDWENIGGRSYNKTYNKSYSTSGAAQGTVIVSNSGNFDTHPIITFYGPVTNPQAVLFTSAGDVYFFTLNGLTLFDVTDYVVVDFKKHTVTRSNGANLYNYSTGSDWWLLEPNPIVNNVRFLGNPIDAPAHMTIQWRNAYVI